MVAPRDPSVLVSARRFPQKIHDLGHGCLAGAEIIEVASRGTTQEVDSSRNRVDAVLLTTKLRMIPAFKLALLRSQKPGSYFVSHG